MANPLDLLVVSRGPIPGATPAGARGQPFRGRQR
jgi:hypothetical protein